MRHFTPTTAPLAVLAALALLATSAQAAKIKVSPGGPISSIQAAVDLAQPGDTVLIGAGTYAEAVDVPATKTNLILKGKGKAILDGRELSVQEATFIINVEASGTLIQGLTLRNMTTPSGEALRISETATDVRLVDLRIDACDVGIDSDGPRTTVEDCRLRGCEVWIEADDALVFGTEVRHANGFGILVNGLRARVKKCKVYGIADRDSSLSVGIYLPGDDALAVGNEVHSVAGLGIYTPSDRAVVKKNDVSGCAWMGIYAPADQPTVEKNTITGGERGIFAAGANASVRSNSVRQALEGIRVAGSPATIVGNTVEEGWSHRLESGEAALSTGMLLSGNDMLIEGNVVRDVQGIGLVIGGLRADVRENRVERCGSASGAFASGEYPDTGFEIAGADHVLIGNEALECYGDGFRIDGTNVRLEKNTAFDNLRDGFDLVIDGSLHTLIGNVARRNAAEGLDLSAGGGNQVRENVFTDNRLDVAVDGSLGSFADNVFETGGTTTAPEID